MDAPNLPPFDAAVLPVGICAQFIEKLNGLRIHLMHWRHGYRIGQPCGSYLRFVRAY